MNAIDILRETRLLFMQMADIITEYGRTDFRYHLLEMNYAINLIDKALSEYEGQDYNYENELDMIKEIGRNLYHPRVGLSEFHIWPDQNGTNNRIYQINDRLWEILRD